jgi:misacylated tRNA(Ala) deacylase
MTELLFQKDAYLHEHEATIVEVHEREVVLDRCAFYPGGGGQPADEGVLEAGGESYDVVGARRDGDKLWLELDRDPPPADTPVMLRLDWDRRYALMRTHTAMHILCGVVWRDHGAKVTGGNMQPGQGRMDFEFEQMSGELVKEIQEKINVEVDASRPISVHFLPRAEADKHPDLIRTKVNLLPKDIEEVRVVEIHELDTQADGGTHVSHTDEVGPIEITGYKSKGKANKRIEIRLAGDEVS